MKRPKDGWELLCAHANEVSLVCPCPLTCGCRYYHCRVGVENTVPKRDESKLKSKLMERLKEDAPGFVALRHEDVRTAGIPDMSLTGHARTSWWEFKHGTPDFDSSGIQELTMLRLAACGFARYVVWEQRGDVKRTLIVRPRNLGTLTPEAWCVDFDHRWLVGQMLKVHGL